MDRIVCKDEVCQFCQTGDVIFGWALTPMGVVNNCLYCEVCDRITCMGISKARTKLYALDMMILPRCYTQTEKERLQDGKQERQVNHWAAIQTAEKTKPAKPKKIKKTLPKPDPVSAPASSLRTMPYAQYLKTPHWQSMRKAALARVEYRCQLCNSNGSLDVHHRTYERRGCERTTDLTVLCRVCHSTFHGK